MGGGNFRQQFDDVLWIGGGTGGEGDFQAALAVGEGPVGDVVGDEVAVGDDDFGTGAGADDAGADADVLDGAGGVTDLDDNRRL